MSTDTTIDIEALLRCTHWRWMPGMLCLSHTPVQAHGPRHSESFTPIADGNGQDWEPDLTDPATLGCLLHLVREAWSGTYLAPYEKERGWWIAIMPAGPWPNPAATEAEALVNALLAAP